MSLCVLVTEGEDLRSMTSGSNPKSRRRLVSLELVQLDQSHPVPKES